MKITPVHRDTFRKGSTTYYHSSIFFPPEIRREVFVLYGFVRVADDYVDQVPQDAEGFRRFKRQYEQALSGQSTGDEVVDSFVDLMKAKKFDPSWVDGFLHSMELDLTKRIYATMDETLDYIYGSAEVIGLLMAKLIGLPEESYRYAKLQGRAMQYINFIRDLAEDRTFGRTYLPLDGWPDDTLSEDAARRNPEQFALFVRKQIDQYLGWQREAEEGYAFIPKRYRIPIKTASDMYNWTARKIAKDPMIVFERKVKPHKLRIIFQVLWNTVLA
jgi:15-cis-phytoene synthase